MPYIHHIHEYGHSAVYLQIPCRNRLAFQAVGDDDIAHAFFQVHQVMGQAQYGHDFRSDSNHEMVFPGEAANLAAQSDDDTAQGPVIHIHGLS